MTFTEELDRLCNNNKDGSLGEHFRDNMRRVCSPDSVPGPLLKLNNIHTSVTLTCQRLRKSVLTLFIFVKLSGQREQRTHPKSLSLPPSFFFPPSCHTHERVDSYSCDIYLLQFE